MSHGEPVDAAGLRPITDDDETIERMLADVSVPTLVLSMVHLTGDLDWIRGDIRPAACFLNEFDGFMDDETKATVRKRAARAIAEYRDRGCTLPPPPSAEVVQEMMSWLVCQPMPDEYVPLMLEELDLSGTDPRRVDWSHVPVEARSTLPVVVIGAGMSGLLAGIRLAQAGVPFTIIEKNAGPGGTWYENRYPGARVDVGNHFYCYSFEPSDHWSEYFSRQPELAAYFDQTMRRHGIEAHTRFDTEVVRAAWDDDRSRWDVTVRGADGDTETIEAAAVISGVGQLNRPKLPDIEGRDDFTGEMFHSARWPRHLDVTGKRVVMIGAGASGFQIAPEIAPLTEHLTIFQRTAQWMFPNEHYHEAVGDGTRWAMRHLPFYGRWFRFLIFWPSCDGGLPAARIDPDWDGDGRSVSALNDMARQYFEGWFRDQVGDDPELLAKVLPDYPATGKRTLQDNGSWLTTLKRDDVELLRCGIERIDATGVIDAEGVHHDADIIVFATGFHADRFLWPIEIIGRDGVSLEQRWDGRPAAFQGICIPGFPNLFCMYGPGTNLATGGSLIFHSECQMRFIEQCLQWLCHDDTSVVEVTEAATTRWFEATQEELSHMVWTHPGVTSSWYRSADGNIYGLSPWRLVDYWTWTRQPDPADFVVA